MTNQENQNNNIISEEYRNAVESYARERKNYTFHNKGNEHAKIILPLIFRNAKREVRIAAQNLWNQELVNTSEYIESAKSYLDKQNTTFHIIVTNFPKKEIEKALEINSFYKMWSQHPAYDEKRVIVKDSHGRSFKQNGNPVNFCTADGSMYRLEVDIQNRMALCNFNDPNETAKMNTVFDRAWKELEGNDVDLKQCFNNAK